MNTIKMPLSELKLPERNIRRHTEKQLHEFERSVTMFGQIRPIVVDENHVILAGNGLFFTLERLGYEAADVLIIPGLSDIQKKKLMIADNKIFSLGIEDYGTLESFLRDFGDDLDVPGYDEDLLRSMVADAEEVTERISNYGKLDPETIEDMQAAGERKDALIQRTEYPQAQENVADANVGNIKRMVICPKCGEEIWV